LHVFFPVMPIRRKSAAASPPTAVRTVSSADVQGEGSGGRRYGAGPQGTGALR
jgi:hypothetical protein